jgi:hypothetical protein
MDPQLAVDVVAAVGIALMVVRYWRVLAALAAVAVLSLTMIGLMTVISNWPRQ